MVPRDADAQEALQFVLRWLDARHSEEDLGRSALTQMEPLVDWHWTEIADQLIELMKDRADLRIVVANSMFDASVPDDVQDRLFEASRAAS